MRAKPLSKTFKAYHAFPKRVEILPALLDEAAEMRRQISILKTRLAERVLEENQ